MHLLGFSVSASPGAAESFELATGDDATHFDTHVSFQHHMHGHALPDDLPTYVLYYN